MKPSLVEEVAQLAIRFPGIPEAMDGSTAVVEMETAASDAAGAYPITPSTQMGEGWALAMAQGKENVFGRRLLFFEPEGEHAAAGVTAGMSMMGLRATNFSSGQGIAYMHESLYAAVGKRLTYVLNMACRAMTKHSLNVHAGHDDYHSIDDTGFFQLFAKDVQESADLNLIAHRVAELSLCPGVCAQDGFLTSHVIESLRLPERELVREYLGDPADIIESPTPAQRSMFGERRRRIPELFDYDNPAMVGVVQNQDSYAQGVAAQRPFFFDHVVEFMDQAMREYRELTGRHYARTSGYRLEDAEYVIVGQGSLVANAEAAVDWLRDNRKLKIGVVNVTAFRPFPTDLIVEALAGKTAAVVLERLDQPLSVDPPMLREIRAAMAKAVENQRCENDEFVHHGVPSCRTEEVPDFYSGCFGLGSRDLQPGDLIAAVDNMLPGGAGRRQFYLGIDFIRRGVVSTKLQKWQAEIVKGYPGIQHLALSRVEDVDLLPEGSLALRIHSVGGWGAITMGKNLTMTLFDLVGMQVKSNPKYGSEKKGQPTTFYGVFAHAPIRTNCELKHVDVVLSPDGSVFHHSNPLDGLGEGGILIIQHNEEPSDLWKGFPTWAQKTVRDRNIRVFHLDGFSIAQEETDIADLQYRMQGAAFQGAFFKASPIVEREDLDEEKLFANIHKQLQKKFGHRGEKVVEDNYRVIRRGYDSVVELDWQSMDESSVHKGATGEATAKWFLSDNHTAKGIADPHRFLGQVCSTYAEGLDPIADPFSAVSAIPAATSVFRDMTGIRFEVPWFVAENCTGCGQCWTQCPDSAIPGIVSEIDDILTLAATNGKPPSAHMTQLLPALATAARAVLGEVEFKSIGDTLDQAYGRASKEAALSGSAKKKLNREFAELRDRISEFPLAKTAPFFTVPERKNAGSGGLLSITISPYACKGCNLCVDVCPDEALVTVTQEDHHVETLRRNWDLWEKLPDTPDRFLSIVDLDEGIGVLHTLLLKKANYLSMVGGDGACSGCGEKTAVHLVLAAIEAYMQPRVAGFVAELDDLIRKLRAKVNEILIVSADLEKVTETGTLSVDVEVGEGDRARLARVSALLKLLEDLRWRYTAGPSGKGRAALGISNSTGCSSVWGSTFPYNPYPYPWCNHLFQDAPSVAVGIFEGLMRKMADAFATVRRAHFEVDDAYDPEAHEKYFRVFDWHEFTDEEFGLCPPLLALGGDGAMLDIGFQNLSRMLASGKPIRAIVLDTQVYSNTGGQACTSGFVGQVSDMAAFGAARHGKEEQRKEMSLLAMAHRNTYVVQTSQALASHLIGSVLRGLNSRRPAVFNIYSVCQPEHGVPDDGATTASKLAMESRAFPHLVYDPDAGTSFADCLDLDGNPELESDWPAYDLTYLDEDGEEQTLDLPMTVGDWCATEARFARHFRKLPESKWTDDLVPFHEFVAMSKEDREKKAPFIYVLDGERHLGRLSVSNEIVELAEDRLQLWRQLRQMAGVDVPESARNRIKSEMEAEFQQRMSTFRSEVEAEVTGLKEKFPSVISDQLAHVLLADDDGASLRGLIGSGPSPTATAADVSAPEAAAQTAPVEQDQEEAGGDAYIDSELCTTCDDCMKVNPKMFVYDDDKKAYIKDYRAGPFKDMVVAAEKCPAQIIHPGTPHDPNEPDLEKWIARAANFN